MTREQIYFALTKKHEAFVKARREYIIRKVVITLFCGCVIALVALSLIAFLL